MNHDTIDFLDKMWLWPPHDKRLRQFMDEVHDLDAALKHVPERRTAVQAGGAMGVWAWYLSKHFATVWSFEASSDNYFYLSANTLDCANVLPVRCALGSECGWATMKRPPDESENVGAYYTELRDKGGMRVRPLDQVLSENSFVDFIQLDVEGRECDVLIGAENIILRDHPVIMLESKPLPQDEVIGSHPGDAIDFLEALGYVVVDKIHRDVIMKHEENTN